MPDNEKLADDLLFGAEQIAQYLGLTPRQVYHQQQRLGLIHLGSLLVGSKIKLKRLLTDGEAA
jgi:hypothetical protein